MLPNERYLDEVLPEEVKVRDVAFSSYIVKE